MSKVYDGISAELQAFLERQPMFFVATAPLAPDGHVNVSPKGLDGTFAVLSEHRVAYLDLTGSGIETVADVRENARITLMFCAFDGPARIVRLSGRGDVVTVRRTGLRRVRGTVRRFPGRTGGDHRRRRPRRRLVRLRRPAHGAREQRERLLTSLAAKGDAGLAAYRAERNATSIDGLPGLVSTAPGPSNPGPDPGATEGPHRPVRPLCRLPLEMCGYEPALLIWLPSVLNLSVIPLPRKETAAITAKAMSATRRMYSTMLAPRSVAVNLAWSHVRITNRFMVLPLLIDFHGAPPRAVNSPRERCQRRRPPRTRPPVPPPRLRVPRPSWPRARSART